VPAETRLGRRDRLGRWFARFATERVVAHPWLWTVFRGPIRWQFGRLAGIWDHRRGPEALASLDAALARVGAPVRVLDLGTGTGKAARLVAERFPDATVTGVDLAPEMVEEACRLVPAEQAVRLTFEVGDASRLPFPDGTFDLVVLLNMIPFFPELARVAGPGGVVVIAFSSGPGTPIYVPPETLRDRLAQSGFGEFETLEAGPGTAFLARRPPAS
jgi:SAM-dependent methyltransferase